MAAPVVTYDGLTMQQERFCQAFIANSASEDRRERSATYAYRQAYSVGEKTLEGTVWTEASLLMSDPKVAQRLKVLAEEAILAAGITPAWPLAVIRRLGDQGSSEVARIKAAELAMRFLGLLGKGSGTETQTQDVSFSIFIGERTTSMLAAGGQADGQAPQVVEGEVLAPSPHHEGGKASG